MLMMPTRPPYALTSMISPKLRFALGFIVSLSLKPVCIEAGQEAQGTSSLDDILYQNFGNLTSLIATLPIKKSLKPGLPICKPNYCKHLRLSFGGLTKPDLFDGNLATTSELTAGNSSNGLPERLQGIYWQDGVIQPELAISTAGEWDPVQRRLRLVPSRYPVWAINYTSSQQAPGTQIWLPSGAGHFNQFAYEAVRADIYFNEDISFGQIYVQILDIDFRTPPIILNWTMTYLPDGSWLRESSTLGIPTGIGRYYLRKIIDGNGQPVLPWFNQWLQTPGGDYFGRIQLV